MIQIKNIGTREVKLTIPEDKVPESLRSEAINNIRYVSGVNDKSFQLLSYYLSSTPNNIIFGELTVKDKLDPDDVLAEMFDDFPEMKFMEEYMNIKYLNLIDNFGYLAVILGYKRLGYVLQGTISAYLQAGSYEMYMINFVIALKGDSPINPNINPMKVWKLMEPERDMFVVRNKLN